MRDIDWKILMILYEKRSITKTAEALYLTQSAVTKRIQAIETEWDVEIVRRSSQGVSFTKDGHYLVQRASIMLDFLAEIEAHFAEERTKKECLTIGVPNSFARLHMPKLLKEYIQRYVKLEIRAVPNSSDAVVQKLMDGTLDLGFVCGDFPYLGEKAVLFEEDLFLLVPNHMEPESISHMPVIKSYLNPLVQLITDQWWRNQYGNLPHESYKVPFSDIAIEMVENGLGVTFLFGRDWPVDLEKAQLIPLYDQKDNPVTRRVWMMLSDRCFHSQDIMDFVSLVEELYHINR